MGPLTGLRIAVTRATAQAEELAEPLRAAGADVLLTPLIRIAPATESAELRRVSADIAHVDRIVFTSVNGVRLFMDAFRHARGDAAALGKCRVACVGPATAEAARQYGLTVDTMPEQFVGEAVADALANGPGISGQTILLPRATGARPELPERLRAGGATVIEVELYRSVPDDQGIAALQAHAAAGTIDILTFTSASTVRYFAEGVSNIAGAKVAVIGPVTAQAARAEGLEVLIEAEPHTTAGLVSAIIEYATAHRGSRRNA